VITQYSICREINILIELISSDVGDLRGSCYEVGRNCIEGFFGGLSVTLQECKCILGIRKAFSFLLGYKNVRKHVVGRQIQPLRQDPEYIDPENEILD